MRNLLAQVGTISLVAFLIGSFSMLPASAETIYQQPFAISTPGGQLTASTSGPAYAAPNGTADACVTTTDFAGDVSPAWRFALVWVDGGNNLVVYRSPDYTTPKPSGVCSGNQFVGNNKPKYFIRITVTTADPNFPARADGLWDLDVF